MKVCACGRPLHYKDKKTQKEVQDLVDKLGECVLVGPVYSFTGYQVPRHYIALHGLETESLDMIARKYGFKEVSALRRATL